MPFQNNHRNQRSLRLYNSFYTAINKFQNFFNQPRRT